MEPFLITFLSVVVVALAAAWFYTYNLLRGFVRLEQELELQIQNRNMHIAHLLDELAKTAPVKHNMSVRLPARKVPRK